MILLTQLPCLCFDDERLGFYPGDSYSYDAYFQNLTYRIRTLNALSPQPTSVSSSGGQEDGNGP